MKTKFMKTGFLDKPNPYIILQVFIILWGLYIRTRQYLWNRSLWLDEACVAWNILKHSYSGLTGPLEYGQAVPLFFLYTTKLFAELFGYSDFIYRLLPFYCRCFVSIPQ
ncbi:MAG: hypothetical protein U5R06_04455 [candidate division KSB1 bacterium]|nr:hypothetical protein [candidate division KSB1 bacterium]